MNQMKKLSLSFCLAAAAMLGLAFSATAAEPATPRAVVAQATEAGQAQLVQPAQGMPGNGHRDAMAVYAFALVPAGQPGVRLQPVHTSTRLRGTSPGLVPPATYAPAGELRLGRSSPNS